MLIRDNMLFIRSYGKSLIPKYWKTKITREKNIENKNKRENSIMNNKNIVKQSKNFFRGK